jgi:hypothetical protein
MIAGGEAFAQREIQPGVVKGRAGTTQVGFIPGTEAEGEVRSGIIRGKAGTTAVGLIPGTRAEGVIVPGTIAGRAETTQVGLIPGTYAEGLVQIETDDCPAFTRLAGRAGTSIPGTNVEGEVDLVRREVRFRGDLIPEVRARSARLGDIRGSIGNVPFRSRPFDVQIGAFRLRTPVLADVFGALFGVRD